MKIKNIVFDFGGVLIDWNPRYLYQDYFDSKEEMEYFLANVCTQTWNEEQDRGRSLAQGSEILQKQFPQHRFYIDLFYKEWSKMIKSEIHESVAILYHLKEKHKLYGLSNWSAETFPIAWERFSFFKEFDGIVLSGQEKTIKPEKKIFEILLQRYQLKAQECFFIDDVAKNVVAAQELGINAVLFSNPQQLKNDLVEWELW